jgi:hypothetical protein
MKHEEQRTCSFPFDEDGEALSTARTTGSLTDIVNNSTATPWKAAFKAALHQSAINVTGGQTG